MGRRVGPGVDLYSLHSILEHKGLCVARTVAELNLFVSMCTHPWLATVLVLAISSFAILLFGYVVVGESDVWVASLQHTVLLAADLRSMGGHGLGTGPLAIPILAIASQVELPDSRLRMLRLLLCDNEDAVRLKRSVSPNWAHTAPAPKEWRPGHEWWQSKGQGLAGGANMLHIWVELLLKWREQRLCNLQHGLQHSLFLHYAEAPIDERPISQGEGQCASRSVWRERAVGS